jgi:hypothetical protein
LGSPRPRAMSPDDANMPPWVHGRIDALYVEIHGQAQQVQNARTTAR